MKAPTHVTTTLQELRSERLALSARLDTVDLAIANLQHLYPPTADIADATDGGSAAARRADLLAVIRKADKGLTARELRAATPAVPGKLRSNALYALKAAGHVKRTGNRWVAR